MRSFACVLLAFATAAADDTRVAEEQALRERLSALLQDESLSETKIGAMVADVDSGRVLFSHNADLGLIPASNVKLATTTAALAMLGPEYRFRTEVLGAHEPGTDLVKGDLVLRGLGDPTLVTESLHHLASRLRTRGIRRVEGGMIVDDEYFEPPPPPEEPDTRPDADAAYRAPPSALSLNFNSVRITATPSTQAGTPATIEVSPDSWYFVVSGGVKTVERGARRLEVRVVPQEERTELVVSGRLPLGAQPIHVRRRVPHPALYAGRTLLSILRRHGIVVARPNVRARPTPEELPILAAHVSDPLSTLIRSVNKLSNNVMADQLLMALGAHRFEAPGTFEKGLKAVGDHLAEIGVPREWFTLASGSGLERETRLNAATLVRVLRTAARDFRYAADFQSSLAVSGADGTLSKRFSDSPAARFVRAKSGTLAGVIALSGYVGGPRRRLLAFAVLLNDPPSRQIARQTADALSEALVEHLAR